MPLTLEEFRTQTHKISGSVIICVLYNTTALSSKNDLIQTECRKRKSLLYPFNIVVIEEIMDMFILRQTFAHPSRL